MLYVKFDFLKFLKVFYGHGMFTFWGSVGIVECSIPDELTSWGSVGLVCWITHQPALHGLTGHVDVDKDGPKSGMKYFIFILFLLVH